MPALLGRWGTNIYVIWFAAGQPQVDCGLMLELWRGEKARRQECLRYSGAMGYLLYVVGFAACARYKWIASLASEGVSG